jgi:hypothetical protein
VLEAAETLARQPGLLSRLASTVGDEGYFADQFLELVRVRDIQSCSYTCPGYRRCNGRDPFLQGTICSRHVTTVTSLSPIHS